MNILPKKSWHVRNKDNIEKVRRDEQAARDQEAEEERRRAVAEQQARTQLLRHKAGLKPEKEGALELFSSVDSRVGNTEHAREKKEEREKEERKLGVLTYLGQSAVDQSAQPWYFQAPDRKCGPEVDAKRKSRLDPFTEVSRRVKRKKMKEKKKKKKSRLKSLEDLRAERLEREKKERARSKALTSGVTLKSADDVVSDLRDREFNNQFNPHLSKSSKRKFHDVMK